MVLSTQIARIDGLMLAASVDDEQSESELSEPKSNAKMVIRRLNRNSEPQATIECGKYTIQYSPPLLPLSLTLFFFLKLVHVQEAPPRAIVESHSYLISSSICFLTICDKSYPRKLAFTYLSDLADEFTTTYNSTQYLSPTLRPYAFVEFDTFIQRTKKTYQDSRATQNLDKLNSELKDVTKVMTKNIEDLLYRGDSLERMGDMSQRLREDSRKYRKAAVRINWELLLKQYGPFGAVGLIMLVFVWWRFF
ncbi:SNAP receptor [Trapelia coarctata]|nr:SNAP receptor [Trapelia coarctata]